MSNLSSYNLNTTSTSNGRVTSTIGKRVAVDSLFLPIQQSVAVNVKGETLIVNSSTAPMWNSSHTFNLCEKGIALNDITLKLELPPLSGTNLVATYVPGQYMIDHINILYNGQIVDTLWADDLFLKMQLYSLDCDRLTSNMGSGLYSSSAQRLANISSQTTSNIVLVPLRCFVNSIHPNILVDAHNIQLTVYMNTQLNSLDITSGTLTQNNNIISSTLICKIVRLPVNEVAVRLKTMAQMKKFDNIFHSTIVSNFVAQAGVTSSTFVLSNLMNANVAQLFFVVRTSKVGSSQFNFLKIASLNILDGSSNSLVGGAPLPSSYLANIVNRDLTTSSYNSETSFGTNNQNANVYIHSFSGDIITALQTGACLGHRRMQGTEQIVITYTSTLTQQVYIDVYAQCQSILQMSLSSVLKA